MTSYPNYENTIEEHDETAVNDDSDSGIDSLYECIKFKTNDIPRQHTASGPDFYFLDYFCFTLLYMFAYLSQLSFIGSLILYSV